MRGNYFVLESRRASPDGPDGTDLFAVAHHLQLLGRLEL